MIRALGGLLILLAFGTIPTGCGAPASDAPATDTPPAAATDAPPALGPNILYNGSFEDWDGKALKGWAAAQGAGADWTPMTVTRVKGLHRASYAVSLPAPPEGHYAILAQNIAARWIETGKQLYFGVVMHADHPFQAQIVLSYRSGGIEHKERAVHSGNGQWESVYGSVMVPEDADPASFRLELFRNPGLDGNVWLDDAGVAYAAAAGSKPATETAATPHSTPEKAE